MHRNHLTTHINEWHRCILVITRAGFVFRSVKCMKIFTPSITDDILPLCCCRYCCRRHHRCHIGKHMLCTHRHHFNANSLDCSTFNYIIVNTLIKHRFHLCGAYSLFIFIQRNLLFYVITCKSTGWMVFLVFVCAYVQIVPEYFRCDLILGGRVLTVRLWNYMVFLFALSHCQMFTAITIGNKSNIIGVGGELIEWENIIN